MKFFSEHKVAVILSGCALLIIALTVYMGLNSSQTTAMENAVKTTTTPVQRFFSNLGSGISDVTHSIGRIKELRIQYNEYERQLKENSEMMEENDRLKRMLELRDDNPDLNMVAASVAADEPSNWFSGFTIDKGRNSGLEQDQVVISSDGFLIGKISRVGNNWADVMTVIDPGFSAGTMVERSRDLGVSAGDSELRYNKQFKMSYLTRETDIREGDYIITTGLGGIFPSGLRLGKVAEIKEDTATMSRYAVVDLSVDLKDVRQVFVITNNFDVVADEENANMKAAREEAEKKQEELDRESSEEEDSRDDNSDENSDDSDDNSENEEENESDNVE